VPFPHNANGNERHIWLRNPEMVLKTQAFQREMCLLGLVGQLSCSGPWNSQFRYLEIRTLLIGAVDPWLNLGSGCHFASFVFLAFGICKERMPKGLALEAHNRDQEQMLTLDNI
jgi:hypothetical protein